jgi:hypothetical protein
VFQRVGHASSWVDDGRSSSGGWCGHSVGYALRLPMAIRGGAAEAHTRAGIGSKAGSIAGALAYGIGADAGSDADMVPGTSVIEDKTDSGAAGSSGEAAVEDRTGSGVAASTSVAGAQVTGGPCKCVQGESMGGRGGRSKQGSGCKDKRRRRRDRHVGVMRSMYGASGDDDDVPPRRWHLLSARHGARDGAPCSFAARAWSLRPWRAWLVTAVGSCQLAAGDFPLPSHR